MLSKNQGHVNIDSLAGKLKGEGLVDPFSIAGDDSLRSITHEILGEVEGDGLESMDEGE